MPFSALYKCVKCLALLVLCATESKILSTYHIGVLYLIFFVVFIKLVPSWLKAAPHVVSFLGFSLKCLFFPGMSIVLAVAEGEVFVNDAEIQKSALQVVINCVCAPDKRMSSIGKFIAGSPRRRVPQQTKASESVLTKMWNVVQSNNGIKVELNGGLKSPCVPS